MERFKLERISSKDTDKDLLEFLNSTPFFVVAVMASGKNGWHQTIYKVVTKDCSSMPDAGWGDTAPPKGQM